jgi:hypothetical protein
MRAKGGRGGEAEEARDAPTSASPNPSGVANKIEMGAEVNESF